MRARKTVAGRRLLPAFWTALVLCLGLPALAQDERPAIGKAAWDLPIFDAHMHYNDDAWDGVSADLVLRMMDKAGVAMALVSSTPDPGTIRLFEHAPNRIVPELRPYHSGVGRTIWLATPSVLEYLARRLDTYPHRGIGEFHTFGFGDEGLPVLHGVADLAQKRGLHLHVHADHKVVDALYAHAPGLTIVWAHAGMVDPPDVVSATLAKYPNLYADLSYREREILTENGAMNEDWRAVLMKHSSRFMVASDTWSNPQWARYDELIETNRRMLALLPRAEAEAIAFKNAERLFGQRISRDLIGQR